MLGELTAVGSREALQRSVLWERLLLVPTPVNGRSSAAGDRTRDRPRAVGLPGTGRTIGTGLRDTLRQQPRAGRAPGRLPARRSAYGMSIPSAIFAWLIDSFSVEHLKAMLAGSPSPCSVGCAAC